jgi:hypothetical protein
MDRNSLPIGNQANSKRVRFRELNKRYSLPILRAQEQPKHSKLLPSRAINEYQAETKQLGKTINLQPTKKLLSRQHSWPLSSTPAFAPVFQLNKEAIRKYTAQTYKGENYVYKKRHFTMQSTLSNDYKSCLKLPRVTEVAYQRSDRSHCDSITGSLQCSSLTSKTFTTRQKGIEKDYGENELLKSEPDHVVRWLKTSFKMS